MRKKTARPPQPASTLRQRAEAILRLSQNQLARAPKRDIARTIHELEVHQVELQMQNEELRESQTQLAQSRDRFHALYDFAPIGYFTLDQSGIILEANLTLATMLGVDRQKLLGTKLTRFIAPDGQDTLYLHLRDTFASEEKHSCELPIRAGRGAEIFARIESIVVRDPHSNALHCWSAVSDVTAHKRFEDALVHTQAHLEQRVADRTRSLKESEERLSAILNTVLDAIITIDQKGNIFNVNPATLRMFGYSESEMIGQNIKILMTSPVREELDRYLENYRRFGPGNIIGVSREVLARRKDGTIFPIEASVSEVDHLGLFTGVIRDITQRKQLQRQLLDTTERIQREFGHELHDGLGQRLTGLEMMSHSLAKSFKADSPQAARVQYLNRELRETLTQARLISHSLAPVPLDGDGLMLGLRELAASTARIPGVQCHFVCDPPVHLADVTAATQLYRIAQEAVNNALKHGKASRVDIRLSATPSVIELCVENNGRTPRPEPLRGASGVGLNLMKYRAELIGAIVRIEPRSPRGVSVVCTLRIKP